MSTLEKTAIKPTWEISKVQELIALSMNRQCMTAVALLSKVSPDAALEYQKELTKFRADNIKQLGVKTPIELVRAMGEFETNVFGSKVIVSGDDKSASLEYESCACYNAMIKNGLPAGFDEEKAGKGFQTSVELLAQEFGFKGQVTFGTKGEEKTAVITFTK